MQLLSSNLVVGMEVGIMGSRARPVSIGTVTRILKNQVEVAFNCNKYKTKFNLKTLNEVGQFSHLWLTTVERYKHDESVLERESNLRGAWNKLQSAVNHRDFSKVLLAVQAIDALQDDGE